MLQKRKEIFLLIKISIILDVIFSIFQFNTQNDKKLDVHWEHQGKFLQSSHNNEAFLAIQHLLAAICR